MDGPSLNGSSDLEASLDELSKQKVKDLAPVFVVVSILMAFGLFGNGSVLLFFWRKASETVATVFIIVLAIVDTSVCLTISFLIMELNMLYKYTSNVLCRIQMFSKFFTALFSVLVLVTIAFNRYRSICCPYKRQLTLFGARIAVIVDMLIAVAFSVPMSLLNEVTDIKVPNENNFDVTGSGCIFTQDEELQKYLTGMNYTFCVLFVVVSVVFVVLYSLIGRVVQKYNKKHARLQCRYEVNESCSSSNDKSVTNTPKLAVPMSVVPKPTDKTSTKAKDEGQQSPNEQNETVDEIDDKSNKATCRNIDNKSKELVSSLKITIMFFTVTVGFILCFLPYIIYVIKQSFTPRKATKLVSISVETLLLTSSYFINSISNPIIYGFLHTEFRQFLGRFFCCWRNN